MIYMDNTLILNYQIQIVMEIIIILLLINKTFRCKLIMNIKVNIKKFKHQLLITHKFTN